MGGLCEERSSGSVRGEDKEGEGYRENEQAFSLSAKTTRQLATSISFI